MTIDLSQIRTSSGRINSEMTSQLKPDHYQHLIDEGFSDAQVQILRGFRVSSIDTEWSKKNGIAIRDDFEKLHCPSGLLFPFTTEFGQIRVDGEIIKNGKRVKYITCFFGASRIRKVGAWLPRIGESDRTEVITEGYKDAAAGTLIGEIATGAIAGVSHARKALPKGSKQVILFDSDGWYNPSVFTQLCHAAKHTGGKVQLVPTIPGEPKAGLCEYFKAGYKAWHYRQLIDSAMPIADFLFELPKHWAELTAEQLRKCRRSILSLAVQYLDKADQDRLLSYLSSLLKIGKRALNSDRDTFARKLQDKARREAKKAKKEQAEKQVEALKIPMRRNRDGEVEVPKAGVTASVLEQKYRDQLAWHPGLQKFFRYESESKGLWSQEPIEEIRNLIRTELDASGAEHQYDSAYISSVSNLMSYSFAIADKKWEQPAHLLPFQNGVLNVKTKEFLPHSPLNRLVYQVPHVYDPMAQDCKKINDWLKLATNNDDRSILVLKSFVKATIEGHPELQKFLHLTGKPRSGKGTFTRLIAAILGTENAVAGSLKKLDSNQFELSRYYQRRLVTFEDEDRYTGDLSDFKKLTGQDELICERKNKDGFGFRYTGMVIVTSNHPIFSGNAAIEKREVIVPFDVQIADKDRLDMDEELRPEISAFINECLAIPYSIMRAAILQSSEGSGAMSDKAWEYRTRADSVYDWMSEWLVFEKDATIAIGNDKSDLTTIYGSYYQHVEKTGGKPKSLKEFSPYLLEVLSSFGLGIDKKRSSAGNFFVNVRLKAVGEDIESIVETVRNRDRAASEKVDSVESVENGEAAIDPVPSDSEVDLAELPAAPSPESCEILSKQFNVSFAQFQAELAKADAEERRVWTEMLRELKGCPPNRSSELIAYIQKFPLLNQKGRIDYEKSA